MHPGYLLARQGEAGSVSNVLPVPTPDKASGEPAGGMDLLQLLQARYGAALTADQLAGVLTPLLVPISSLDRTIFRSTSGNLWRASFSVAVTPENRAFMVQGRTGKFVPPPSTSGVAYVWRELAKGRILEVGPSEASGEIYSGSNSKRELASRLDELPDDAFWEIDRFGAAAKTLSSLVEFSFFRLAASQGFDVYRMPEDMARHVGIYRHYDFELKHADGSVRKVEVKSLWGTDTRYARLIRSLTKDNPTSSCAFETQDIFAVSMFLRTGNLDDFAFARSVPESARIPGHGLPTATKFPTHVNQNPVIRDPLEPPWYRRLDEVWG
jgi:hypothetical protein